MSSRHLLLLCSFAGISVALQAQILVEIKPEFSRLLQYEPNQVTIILKNDSGTPLVFSGDGANAELALTAERDPGRAIASIGELPLPAAPLPSGSVWTNTFDVLSVFPLVKSGPYGVAAEVSVQGETFSSRRVYFDVVPGFEVLRLRSTSSDGTRLGYSLRTLHRGTGDFLFVRVEDLDEETILGVYGLGRYLGAYPPEGKFDTTGSLHLLFHAAPGKFMHTVFAPEGRPIVHQPYDSAFKAELAEGENGVLQVRIPEPAESGLNIAPPDSLDDVRKKPKEKSRPKSDDRFSRDKDARASD